MRAVTISAAELVWSSRPDPTPADSELLVEVRAAGLNAADLLQLRGSYPPPPGVPEDIPGLELAGRVLATGARVSRFGPGDRVMALVGGAAQAELAVVDEGSAMPVPEELSWEEAGGFPEAFITAYDALFRRGQLGPGERVLITGAAGGVGTAAIQLAASAGARVVASSRQQATRAGLVEMGAEVALDPGEALSAGPFELVLELVSGPGVAEALERLSPEGRIVIIGVGGGRTVSLDLLQLMSHRAHLLGSTLRPRSLAEKSLLAREIEVHVLPLLAARRVRVPVMATYPLERAEEGYRRLAEGGKLGKIVLIR